MSADHRGETVIGWYKLAFGQPKPDAMINQHQQCMEFGECAKLYRSMQLLIYWSVYCFVPCRHCAWTAERTAWVVPAAFSTHFVATIFFSRGEKA